MLCLIHTHGLTLLGPREVKNGNDEEAVGGIGNTSKGVVPGQESCKDAESTSGTSEANVRRAVLEDKVGAAQHQEGQVQCEKQEEEGHSRLECADEEKEGEDEPAL